MRPSPASACAARRNRPPCSPESLRHPGPSRRGTRPLRPRLGPLQQPWGLRLDELDGTGKSTGVGQGMASASATPWAVGKETGRVDGPNIGAYFGGEED